MAISFGVVTGATCTYGTVNASEVGATAAIAEARGALGTVTNQQAYSRTLTGKVTAVLTVSRNFGNSTLTGRELLQEIGAAMRGVDTHFWLRVWRKDYFELKRIGFGVVVDDVRLDAEVQYLRAIDPDIFIVRLTASEEVRRERVGGNLYGAADITERGWTDSRADLTLDTTSLSPEDAYRVITDKMEEG